MHVTGELTCWDHLRRDEIKLREPPCRTTVDSGPPTCTKGCFSTKLEEATAMRQNITSSTIQVICESADTQKVQQVFLFSVGCIPCADHSSRDRLGTRSIRTQERCRGAHDPSGPQLVPPLPRPPPWNRLRRPPTQSICSQPQSEAALTCPHFLPAHEQALNSFVLIHLASIGKLPTSDKRMHLRRHGD